MRLMPARAGQSAAEHQSMVTIDTVVVRPPLPMRGLGTRRLSLPQSNQPLLEAVRLLPFAKAEELVVREQKFSNGA